MSLARIAYSVWSSTSLTPLRKVEKEPQLLVVFVAAAALEEEHMACLDQQHSGKEEQVVVAAAAAVEEDLPIVVVEEDLPISDLDDSSNLGCICCLKDHNYSAVVGFAAEGVYYQCLQHKLQVAH